MNRRDMLLLPGAALAAGTALAQTATPEPAPVRTSHKSLLKYGSTKELYKVPKTAAKSAKYIAVLTAVLRLSESQQQQAATIFTSAMQSHTTLRANIKTAHQGLAAAVRNGDSGAVSQISANLGLSKAQFLNIAANANLQFLQILSTDQQARLAQFQG